MSLNRLSPFPLKACLVGAAAAGSMALMPAPEARAACLTSIASTTNCATFDNVSPSNVVNQYTDGGFTSSTAFRGIKFFASGFTSGLPITLENIAYSFDGGVNFVTTGLAATTYQILSSYTSGNAPDLLTGDQVAVNLTNFRLRYTIPAGSLTPNGGAVISIITADGGPQFEQNQQRASSLNNSNSNPVPAPIPLLGAGAAFGFSRKLRRRTTQSA